LYFLSTTLLIKQTLICHVNSFVTNLSEQHKQSVMLSKVRFSKMYMVYRTIGRGIHIRFYVFILRDSSFNALNELFGIVYNEIVFCKCINCLHTSIPQLSEKLLIINSAKIVFCSDIIM